MAGFLVSVAGRPLFFFGPFIVVHFLEIPVQAPALLHVFDGAPGLSIAQRRLGLSWFCAAGLAAGAAFRMLVVVVFMLGQDVVDGGGLGDLHIAPSGPCT
jgi:hypothetical protein